jgi:hypothetical protein
MKKLLFIPVLILALSLLSQKTLATSGACSYHGGVICSAGADIDGSVICNDGSRDSSVQYSDMLECKQVNHSCTTAEITRIRYELNLDGLSQQIDTLNAQLQQKTTDYNAQYQQIETQQGVPSVFVSGQLAMAKAKASIEIQGIANQVIAAQQNYRTALTEAVNECYSLGNAEYQAQQLRQLVTSAPTPVVSVVPQTVLVTTPISPPTPNFKPIVFVPTSHNSPSVNTNVETEKIESTILSLGQDSIVPPAPISEQKVVVLQPKVSVFKRIKNWILSLF